MKSHRTFSSALSAFALFAGCVGESKSSLYDSDTDIHPDVVQSANVISIKCPATAIVFLLASSEHMSRIETWDIEKPSRKEIEDGYEKSGRDFALAIHNADKDLKGALSRDPSCLGESEDQGIKPELMYISVIDGYSQRDSTVTSIHYRYEGSTWTRSAARKWTYSNGHLAVMPKPLPAAGGQIEAASFELDMSRDAGHIASIFASNTFQTIAKAETLGAGPAQPEQVTYIIKTHGARVLTTDKYAPSLANVTDYMQSGIEPSDWEPAIFIDTNGQKGILKSSAFSAHWPKEKIASLVAGDGLGQTSGDGFGGYQTSGDEDQTSGKGLVFREEHSNTGSNDFLGKRRYGAYAIYTNTVSGPGVNRFGLFVPGRKNPLRLAGIPDLPKNLVILDSCYGSEKILSSLRYTTGSKSNTVVLASVNPLLFHFLDYGALDFAGLLRFPSLLERLKIGADLSDKERTLADNMTNGTLKSDRATSVQDYKKLSIWMD